MLLALVLAPAGVHAAPATGMLPPPQRDPLHRIDLSQDAILQLEHQTDGEPRFRELVAAAVARTPAVAESIAARDEASAIRAGARMQLLPRVDLSMSYFRVLSRAFSNDPQNIVERSRADRRTDAIASIEQTVIDFGATRDRIAAASKRLSAAVDGVEDARSEAALRAIAAWFSVVEYRALVSLSHDMSAQSRIILDGIRRRVSIGASAAADVARMNSSIASADARAAVYFRSQRTAEEQFAIAFGRPAPSDIRLPPTLGEVPSSGDAAAAATREVAAVRAAGKEAAAARLQADAAHADNLPTLGAGIDAGRYGVFETARDYDVRARVTVRWRLFGQGAAVAAQADARALGADARRMRIEEEQRRDATIAWSDLDVLNQQLATLRDSYVAARRSRDAIVERFASSRGTLFDVLEAEDVSFQTAATWIQGLAERDAAHYVLLARTGRLLTALDIKQTNRERPL